MKTLCDVRAIVRFVVLDENIRIRASKKQFRMNEPQPTVLPLNKSRVFFLKLVVLC